VGDKTIDVIIQSAEMMRENGHHDQLVALIGEGIEINGLAGVNTPFGEIIVHQHLDLVAPDTIVVVTEAAYQRMLAQL
jgi:hypothetical protein